MMLQAAHSRWSQRVLRRDLISKVVTCTGSGGVEQEMGNASLLVLCRGLKGQPRSKAEGSREGHRPSSARLVVTHSR